MEQWFYNGTPSQWIKLEKFLITAASIVLLDGIYNWIGGSLLSLWSLLLVYSWKTKVADERNIECKGVFKHRTFETECHRVRDLRLDQSFLLRPMRLSNIRIVLAEWTHPESQLHDVRNGKRLNEAIQNPLEAQQVEKGPAKKWSCFECLAHDAFIYEGRKELKRDKLVNYQVALNLAIFLLLQNLKIINN